MSWTLGIDTSTTLLSLGLYNDNKPELSFTRYVHNSHAEHIMGVIKSFLTLADIKASDISTCGIVTGPGSFTGLRIGISFLKGLFVTGDTKILPLSSLELLANALSVKSKEIAIALDARQDNVFLARFSADEKGLIRRLTEDTKVTKEQFYEQIETAEMIVYDTMGFARSTVFEDIYENPNAFSTDDLTIARGLTVAKVTSQVSADDDSLVDVLNVFPNYMQESYAERVQKK